MRQENEVSNQTNNSNQTSQLPILTKKLSNTNNKIFIIGAGAPSTGTASLKTALEKLKYGPCYNCNEVLLEDHSDYWIKIIEQEINENHEQINHKHINPKEILSVIYSKYNSTIDFPGAYYWEDILSSFPNSKVILTIKDPEEWYKSITESVLYKNIYQQEPFGIRFYSLFYSHRRRWDNFLKLLYGNFFRKNMNGLNDLINLNEYNLSISSFVNSNLLSKEDTIKVYNDHNQNVIDKCPKEKLLVFNVQDGWEPLCMFLEIKEIPNEEFPIINENNDNKEIDEEMSNVNSTGYLLFIGLTSITIISCGFIIRKLLKQ